MNDNIKRIIVSGTSGQDGSYMVDYLLTHTDHLVYGMVRRTAKPDLSNLNDSISNPRFQLVSGDLTDPHSINALVREIKPDYFINLAAQSFVGSSWTFPVQTNQVNAEGVLNCLEALRLFAPACRFYNAGTSEEFGKVEYSPQDEKHPPRPQSPYGSSKVAARHHVRVYRESYGLYAVQGWLFNHESPRRGPEFVTRKITLGVARIAKAIKEGRPFEPIELGNLDAKRDWSHAKDFVEGIWRMVNQEAYPSGKPDSVPREEHTALWAKQGWQPQEYVLASGETHTIREFVEKAFAAAAIKGVWSFAGTQDQEVKPENEVFRVLENGRPSEAVLVRINPKFYRPAEVSLLLGDAFRARAELGWCPQYLFDQLVHEMVAADMAAVGLISEAS